MEKESLLLLHQEGQGLGTGGHNARESRVSGSSSPHGLLLLLDQPIIIPSTSQSNLI